MTPGYRVLMFIGPSSLQALPIFPSQKNLNPVNVIPPPPPVTLPNPGMESATLRWTPNVESDLAWYTLSVGASPETYAPPEVVGKVTGFQVTRLVLGKTSFVARSVNDTSGHEGVLPHGVKNSIASQE